VTGTQLTSTQQTRYSEADSSSTSWEILRYFFMELEGSQPVILFQPHPPKRNSFRIHFNIILPSMPVFQAISLRFSNHYAARIYLQITCHNLHPSPLPLLPWSDNLRRGVRMTLLVTYFFSSKSQHICQGHPVFARPQSGSFPWCRRTPKKSNCDQNEAPEQNYSTHARTHTSRKTGNVRVT
jgi:hypothetical protein